MLDLSGCALHTYDYNWVQMRFPNEPEVINEIKYMRPELQKQVREALQVTPIRLATMNIQFESSAVYVTVKLLQDPGVLAYFGKISNFKLENPSHRRPAENEHLCARQCFKLADCAAFSQCSSMECDLFTDPDFASAYDEDKKSFDYAFDLKMRRKEQDDCNLFIREVSLRSDLGSHLDNRQLIARWNQQVEKSLLRLTFINGKMGNKEIEMIADALSVDVAPGRLLDTVDDLEPTWADELDDERNVERYNDLFRIIFSSNMFDVNQLKAEALSVRQLSWVSLYECQLACANEKTCASYSYCAPYRKCVLTELVPQSLIRNSIVFDSKCVVSQSTLACKSCFNDSPSKSL